MSNTELEKRIAEIEYQLAANKENPNSLTPESKKLLIQQAKKYGVKISPHHPIRRGY